MFHVSKANQIRTTNLQTYKLQFLFLSLLDALQDGSHNPQSPPTELTNTHHDLLREGLELASHLHYPSLVPLPTLLLGHVLLVDSEDKH